MQGSTIHTVAELHHWFKSLDYSLVAIDTETSSLKYVELECIGISLCDGKQSCYVDLLDGDQYDGLLELLRTQIPQIKRPIFHNAAFDLKVLYKLKIRTALGVICTQTAAFLLDENDTVGLKDLAVRLLGVSDVLPYEKALVRGLKSQVFYDYARHDAEWTWALWRLLEPRLESENLCSLFFDIEMPFQFVLRDLEINGVLIDQTNLSRLREGLYEEIGQLQISTYKAGGIKYMQQSNLLGEVECCGELNLDSPIQLSEFIQHKLGMSLGEPSETGHCSVDKHVLDGLRSKHEFISCLMQYREAAKLKTMFLDKAPAFIDGDGRIRASFNNCVARTGRLSSSSPNLQQLPKKGTRHGSIRSLIVAPPGYTLLAADYCFSDDTEVLTKAGWKLFADLTEADKLAQYSEGNITFAAPTARQVLPFDGSLIWIHGGRQVDIQVTPEHACMLLDGHTLKPFRVAAQRYPKYHKQVQSGGVLGGVDADVFLQIAVAVQADGSLNHNQWVVWLKKGRKIERLCSLLSQTDLAWGIRYGKTKGASTAITVPVDHRVLQYISQDKRSEER